MAIRNLRYDDDELLRKRSREIEIIDNKIRELAMDMVETMYKFDGVGLAAPQVGILKRIIVIDIGEGPKVFINPVIKKATGVQTGEEGCLSSPNTFGNVDRPESLVVEAFDIDGKQVKVKAKGLEAVVLSHEIDHLDGILFLDKAYDIYTLTEEEIEEARRQAELEEQELKNKKSKGRNNKKKNKR
ncbi:MAG: peptide deformylase [Clostridia bacterium]|nr:peptide deformylase [Clostridia bacterium]